MTAPINVLIVDTQAPPSDGVITCLRQDPALAVVGQAGVSQAALRDAARLRPDLVLMHLDGQVMDGIEMTRRLCTALPHIRVLVLTLHAKPDYVEQSVVAGARGYVLKSAGGAALLCGIRAVHLGGLYFSPGVVYPPKVVAPEPLSVREKTVLCLVAQGLSSKEIALSLEIQVATVNTHRQSIHNKLGIRKAAGLTRYAIANGLCPGVLGKSD